MLWLGLFLDKEVIPSDVIQPFAALILLYMAVGRNGNVKRNTLLGERIGLYYKAYAKSAGDAVPQFVEEKLKNAG